MIEHLRGRDRKLEPLGWTGQDAEWIALVCLHSGVFTRPQFCHYFDTDRANGLTDFVKALIERKAAVESGWPVMNGGSERRAGYRARRIYRALGRREHPPPAGGPQAGPHAEAPITRFHSRTSGV